MVEMGTFPAMDQGTRAAMRTTVSSRARARFSLSGSASFVSWSVRMIARVWLKEIMEVTTETARIPPKGVILLLTASTYLLIPRRRPVPSKIPA